ncbi:MAG TPA: hypothetical protein DCQ31_18380 [Bacteroidales bacterium]|nr:hypothetical protein [Bacteroidales bacterium]
MKLFFRKIVEFLLGTEENFSFNSRALNSILAVTTIAAAAALLFNLLLGMSVLLVLITALLFLSLLVQYFLVRYKGKFEIVRRIYPFGNLVFFSILWFLNSGSNGSLSFVFLASLVACILIVKRSHAVFIVIISVLTPLILYTVEFYFPDFIVGYTSRTEKFLDLALTFIAVSILLSVFLIKYKNMHLNLRDALISQRNQNIQQARYLELVNKSLTEKQFELSKAYNKMEQNIFMASLIQKSFLKSEDELRIYFKDAFVLLKPKAIISGDFYWVAKVDERIYLIAADGTGHGVAASLITVMGNEILNELILTKKHGNPAEILQELQKKLIRTLSAAHSQPTDYHGMDVGLLCFNTQTKEVEFAGAKNNLSVIRNNKVKTYKGARFGIGVWQAEIENPIPLYTFEYLPNDQFYLYSDGFYSQFGGPNNKRYKQSELIQDLLYSSILSLDQQKDYLQLILNNWKGKYEQNDDVMVIGVKV